MNSYTYNTIPVEEYFKKEKSIKGLDNYKISCGISIWNIVSIDVRHYIVDYVDKKTKTETSLAVFLNSLKSLGQIISLIVRRPHYDNIIFPHPRTYLVNGKYMERLTDPLIDFSDIQKSYIIIERMNTGVHRTPRYHSDKIVFLDFITSTSVFFSKIFKHFVKKKYKNQLNRLFDLLRKEFVIDDKLKDLIVKRVGLFIFYRKLTDPVLKAISPRRCFMAPSHTFKYAIPYCKNHGINVYELQHGINFHESIMYFGDYDNLTCPDYFLTFGRDNVSPYFRVPIEKIINIGFAFKKFVLSLVDSSLDENAVLVISEPNISKNIVSTVSLMAEKYPNFQFDIRCHPQEILSKDDVEKLGKYSNIKVVENKVESFLAISKYNIVIGDNSSVLFEALSLGKRVGRLNFNGMHVITDSKILGGDILNSMEDFDAFLKSNKPSPNPMSLYSDFEPDVVNNLK